MARAVAVKAAAGSMRHYVGMVGTPRPRRTCRTANWRATNETVLHGVVVFWEVGSEACTRCHYLRGSSHQVSPIATVPNLRGGKARLYVTGTVAIAQRQGGHLAEHGLGFGAHRLEQRELLDASTGGLRTGPRTATADGLSVGAPTWTTCRSSRQLTSGARDGGRTCPRRLRLFQRPEAADRRQARRAPGPGVRARRAQRQRAPPATRRGNG